MKMKLNRTKIFSGLSSFAIAAGIPAVADATTTMFQAAAQANADLIHQYSYDGASTAARLADQEGAIDLTEQAYGSGTTADLGYGLGGWDGTSQSFSSYRQIPGSDGDGGAQLRAPGVTFGATFSFEVIISPDVIGYSGGSFDLGYALATRDGGRGYFLVQGDGNLPSPTHPFSSTLGDGYNVGNTNIISGSPLVAGDWYYVAGSYTRNGTTDVTWTNYIANLSAGDTTLTAVGPFTNSGVYPDLAQNLGIGGRWDNGEAFQGKFDEVNLYSAALTGDTFQQHLTALIPEPSVIGLLVLGFIPFLRRRQA